MSFSDFNLKPVFIKSIEAAGYKSPTELQSQLIPLVAGRKSALIWSQSASGKTGAFLIPAMNYILENPAPEKRGARVLILTSRRDRVSQINYTLKRLSADIVMRFGFIVSGRPYQTQMRLMRRPLDIMIATPGRLNDLMNNGKADFSQLEMLIIDDLASIYNKNLQELIENILRQAGADCSSITFVKDDGEIKDYARSLFPSAIEIEVDEVEDESHKSTASNKEPITISIKSETQSNKPAPKRVNTDVSMQQKVHIADDYTHKIAMLDHLLDEFAGESTVIYTATNKSAKMLQENLSNHGHAAELFENVDSDSLEDCDIYVVNDQSNAKSNIKDLQKVDSHIINFDLPHKIENYFLRLKNHDKKQDESTLLLIDGYNYKELKTLEKLVGQQLEQITIPGLEPLKPFVNLGKSKQTNKTKNNQKRKAKGTNNKKQSNPRKKQNKNQHADKNQRRQHKGPFGRLNGGTHRKKKNGTKVGVSKRGTETPNNDRGWQSDFAPPKERSTEKTKPVAIRYSKKRLIGNTKPEEI